MYQVAQSLLSCKTGSSVLKYDIGGFSNAISPKKGSIRPIMVELVSILRLKKSMVYVNPINLKSLGSEWMERIHGSLNHLPNCFEPFHRHLPQNQTGGWVVALTKPENFK